MILKYFRIEGSWRIENDNDSDILQDQSENFITVEGKFMTYIVYSF
jgi:hypothetical protein